MPMTPLAITAHLYTGFASADPWSPTIDGIVGYWWFREHLGPDEFVFSQSSNQNLKPADELPFEKVHHADQWWYACSSPIYRKQATVHRHIHRRFNQDHAEKYLPDGSRKIQVKAGAYKNARLVVQQHITDRVTWHVIGERTEIERLLKKCTHIGAKLGAGFGRVREWSYADGVEDLARHARPLPVDYAAARQIEGDVMWWGLRPPGRIAENCANCIMPTC